MNSVFAPFPRKFVIVFLDDILVYSPSWETHLEHLRLVPEQLRANKFFAKLSKCSIGASFSILAILFQTMVWLRIRRKQP